MPYFVKRRWDCLIIRQNKTKILTKIRKLKKKERKKKRKESKRRNYILGLLLVFGTNILQNSYRSLISFKTRIFKCHERELES